MNKLLLLLPSFLLATPLLAQDEAGLDISVNIEKKFNQRLEGEMSVDTRIMDIDKSSVYGERICLGVGLGYKLVDTKKFDLKASFGFDAISQTKPLETEYTKKQKLKITEERAFARTRTSLGLGTIFKPNKRWTFSIKETVQHNYYTKHSATILKFEPKYKDGEPYYNYDSDAKWNDNSKEADNIEIKDYLSKHRFVLRNKLTMKYDIRHSIFSPYASCDYGCGLNYTANKWKITAGTEIEFTKMHNLDVFYRYQTENDDDEPNGHLVGVGYILKF